MTLCNTNMYECIYGQINTKQCFNRDFAMMQSDVERESERKRESETKREREKETKRERESERERKNGIALFIHITISLSSIVLFRLEIQHKIMINMPL